MIDRTGQPSPDEKAAQREILEGFLDEDDMKRFYKRLPVPWNVVPQPVGKKQEITKMIQMTIKPEDYFTGETESGTYLEWRILVINRIHSKPLSITDKIHLLGSTVKQSDENLRQIFKTGVHNPRTYQRIIRSLEGHYGGKERTYAYLTPLLNLKHCGTKARPVPSQIFAKVGTDMFTLLSQVGLVCAHLKT